MLRITIRSTQVAILRRRANARRRTGRATQDGPILDPVAPSQCAGWTGRQDDAQGSMPHPATPPGGHTAHSNPSRYVFFPHRTLSTAPVSLNGPCEPRRALGVSTHNSGQAKPRRWILGHSRAF